MPTNQHAQVMTEGVEYSVAQFQPIIILYYICCVTAIVMTTDQWCIGRVTLHCGPGSGGVHVVKQQVCLTARDSSTPVADPDDDILRALAYKNLYLWEVVAVVAVCLHDGSHSVLQRAEVAVGRVGAAANS